MQTYCYSYPIGYSEILTEEQALENLYKTFQQIRYRSHKLKNKSIETIFDIKKQNINLKNRIIHKTIRVGENLIPVVLTIKNNIISVTIRISDWEFLKKLDLIKISLVFLFWGAFGVFNANEIYSQNVDLNLLSLTKPTISHVIDTTAEKMFNNGEILNLLKDSNDVILVSNNNSDLYSNNNYGSRIKPPVVYRSEELTESELDVNEQEDNLPKRTQIIFKGIVEEEKVEKAEKTEKTEKTSESFLKYDPLIDLKKRLDEDPFSSSKKTHANKIQQLAREITDINLRNNKKSITQNFGSNLNDMKIIVSTPKIQENLKIPKIQEKGTKGLISQRKEFQSKMTIKSINRQKSEAFNNFSPFGFVKLISKQKTWNEKIILDIRGGSLASFLVCFAIWILLAFILELPLVAQYMKALDRKPFEIMDLFNLINRAKNAPAVIPNHQTSSLIANPIEGNSTTSKSINDQSKSINDQSKSINDQSKSINDQSKSVDGKSKSKQVDASSGISQSKVIEQPVKSRSGEEARSRAVETLRGTQIGEQARLDAINDFINRVSVLPAVEGYTPPFQYCQYNSHRSQCDLLNRLRIKVDTKLNLGVGGDREDLNIDFTVRPNQPDNFSRIDPDIFYNDPEFYKLSLNQETGIGTNKSVGEVIALREAIRRDMVRRGVRPTREMLPMKLDFRITDPGPQSQVTHVDIKRLIGTEILLAQQDSKSLAEHAYIAGRRLMGQKVRYCGMEDGPVSAVNVLHIIDLYFVGEAEKDLAKENILAGANSIEQDKLPADKQTLVDLIKFIFD